MIFLSTVAFTVIAVSNASGYTHVGNHLKCPHGDSTRLFRTDDEDPKTLHECYEICYDTAGCNYFSIGTATSSHPGVCIGCTAEASLSSHSGFDTYELPAAPSSSPILASACLEDGDVFTANGCDYDSFVQGLDNFLDTECPDHEAIAVLEAIFGESPESMINSICADGWDTVPTSTFRDVDDRFDDAFMEDYIKGDTFLNSKFDFCKDELGHASIM